MENEWGQLESDQALRQCQVCGYVAKSRGQLDVHLRVHTGKRPYKCETCGIAFAQKNNLTRHIAQVHSGAGFRCTVQDCSFTTRRRDLYKLHMARHGTLGYQCRLCMTAYFMYQGDLRKHISKAHSQLARDQQDGLAQLGRLNESELLENRLNAENDPECSTESTERTAGISSRHIYSTGTRSWSSSSLLSNNRLSSTCGVSGKIRHSNDMRNVPVRRDESREENKQTEYNEFKEEVDWDGEIVAEERIDLDEYDDGDVWAGEEDQIEGTENMKNAVQSVTDSFNVQCRTPTDERRDASDIIQDVDGTTNSYHDSINNGVSTSARQSTSHRRHSTTTSPPTSISLRCDTDNNCVQLKSSPCISFVTEAEAVVGSASRRTRTETSEIDTSNKSKDLSSSFAIELVNGVNGELSSGYAASGRNCETSKRHQNLSNSNDRPRKRFHRENRNLDRIEAVISKVEFSPSHRNSGKSPVNSHNDEISLSSVVADSSYVKQEFSEDLTVASSQFFHCRTCDIFFVDRVMYTIHAGCHSYHRALDCNTCGFYAKDKYEFASHLARGDHCDRLENRASPR